MRSSPPPLLEGLEGLVTPAPELPPLTRLVSLKRRFSYTDVPSSDPLFSDDLSDAGLPIDSRPRKRAVKCPWWELRAKKLPVSAPQAPARKQQQRSRAFDSGVWMGSDEDWVTAEDFNEYTVEDTLPSASDPRTLAAGIIQRCLEDGNEVVDLSSVWMQGLDDKILQPLELFVPRASTDDSRPPSEDQYTSLEPRLQLYLASNSILRLPLTLLRLPIAVLSLRNNLLTELPSDLGKSIMLQELNISGNQIQYLPWTLHNWFERPFARNLHIHPNPFLSLGSLSADDYQAVRTSLTRKLAQLHWISPSESHIVYLLSSRVTTFDVAGRALSSNETTAHRYSPQLSSAMEQLDEGHTRVRSLFSTALRTAQQAQLPANVSDLMPDSAPPALKDALQTAVERQQVGNERCAHCDRDMVLPRAEWVEYWYWAKNACAISDENVIPFLKRVCSFACVTRTPSVVQEMQTTIRRATELDMG